MKTTSFTRRWRLPMAAAMAFAVSACGSAPSSTGPSDERGTGGDARASFAADPDADCGAPPADLAGLFDEIARRYNGVADAGRELTTGDETTGGIHLKVCRDGLVAAHAGIDRVVVHEGLARTLAEGAAIVAATPDGTERTVALDRLVRRMPAPLALVGAPHDLAGAAVAFVVYHELGHILLGHPALGAAHERSPSTENEADLFAAGLLAAAGYRADGADLVFAILDRINPDGDGAHPSSRERSLRVALARAPR